MAESQNDTRLQLGRVDGRLSALESRIDRHETFVTQKLGLIEEKLDQALFARARNSGTMRAIHWAASGIASVIAWALGHFATSSPGGH
jgi:hypothetical protein